MAAARKPASTRSKAKPKAKPRARARRASIDAMSVPLLEQRHLDLIGLGLVAIGVFLAFPVYFGWDGGAAGQAAWKWRPTADVMPVFQPCGTTSAP